MHKTSRLFILLITLWMLGVQPAATSPSQQGYILADRLGIAHISSATQVTPPERYQQALSLGAGWNRWPLYWNFVEATQDNWNWTAYDRQVADDLRYGLRINAILIGVPPFHQEGERIAGLYNPIFADGTDLPAPGKAINPDNPWAGFVWQAVNRYKPGGFLSQTGGIPRGQGIRIWEVWNEPDFVQFWRGGADAYARMLKVSYIVTKLADPAAQVMFGGLLFPTEDNFLAQVLNVIVQDPAHQANNWYFDIVGVHSYADPWRSGWLTLYARQTMIAFGFRRPIWLNETGVPVWDDYPGPTWQANAVNYATIEQQAWYFIQSAVFAWHEGAERVFLHQLYDDCGDQPAGTNFPPHNGNLCTAGRQCYGDAHGIYRNHADSICFSQHPNPGTARPIAQAYRLLAEIFGNEPFQRGEEDIRLDANFVVLTFDRPRTDERIAVMWNRRTQANTLEFEPISRVGRLVSLQSNNTITPDDDGLFRITLPPATASGTTSGAGFGGLAIGGMPYILIERRDSDLAPRGVDLTPTATFAPTDIPAPTIRPTVDPASDTRPPVANVLPLPEFSPTEFEVRWTGTDDGGIDYFIIWVRVDGGNWQNWQTTGLTDAIYQGVPGSTYEFAAWAVDLAGNWSTNVNLQPQAVTQVE